MVQSEAARGVVRATTTLDRGVTRHFEDWSTVGKGYGLDGLSNVCVLGLTVSIARTSCNQT